MLLEYAFMTGHNRYKVMPNKLNPKTDLSQPMVYQIRIKGHLGSQWTDWFGGVTITLEDNGDTLLTGPVLDLRGSSSMDTHTGRLEGPLPRDRDVVRKIFQMLNLVSLFCPGKRFDRLLF